jgi:hypothetical protein
MVLDSGTKRLTCIYPQNGSQATSAASAMQEIHHDNHDIYSQAIHSGSGPSSGRCTYMFSEGQLRGVFGAMIMMLCKLMKSVL